MEVEDEDDQFLKISRLKSHVQGVGKKIKSGKG